MTSTQNDEKSMLKSAQFRSLLDNNRKSSVKDIESTLEGLDPSFKILDSNFPEKRDRDLMGSTLLHLAYKYQNIEAYNILIRKGTDFTVKNEEGNTVLHEIFDSFFDQAISMWWDIKKNQGRLVSERIAFILSTLSAHVQSKNTNNPSSPKGLTHFHIACAINNIEAVEFFLRSGVSANETVTKAVSDKHFEGYTPLHFTAQFGCHEVTKILLEYGAMKNVVDAKGRTPTDILVERNIAMIDSTTKVHSDIDIIHNEKVINLLWTPLCTKLSLLCLISVMQKSTQAKFFPQELHNVNQCINMDSPSWPGYTALHFAAHVNVHTIKILTRHGANIEAKDANGATPFDMCIERYKAEDMADIISLVPKWKNILLSDGQTKLTDLLMAFKGSNETRDFLVKSNKNVKLFVPLDSSLWPGFTVLHIALLFSARKKCKLDYKKIEQTKGLRRTSPRDELFQPDLTVVTECLKQDADVTAKDQRGWTPIHFAFRLEKKKVVELLLQYHHRMINPVDDENLSHLHVACKVGNQDLVQKLLWNGADVNVAYKGDSPISSIYPGWTPLHIAVHTKNCEITKLLLKFDADVHAVDRDGFTPIHGLRSREISKMLFSVSDLRDVVVEDLDLSYLHVACSIHDVDAVKQLLDLGADVNRIITCKIEKNTNFHNAFRRKGYDGDTPLYCTLMNSHVHSIVTRRSELVSLLLERGADILMKNSSNNCPLHKFLDYDSDELLNVALTTLKHNEDLQKRAKLETGVTMLHLAIRKMDVELIEELLDNGADVNAKIHDHSGMWSGCTSLHVLILGGHSDDERADDFEKILKILLDHGADVTLTNTMKRTPLHIAYRKVYAYSSDDSTARLTSVILMLKAHKNFEFNPTSVEGVSFFHIACHLLDVDAVERFLECNVDVDSKIDVYYDWNIAASTPLLLATRTINLGKADYSKSLVETFAQLKIVDLLIKRGARVNVEDIYGNTPAHYASFGSSSKENLLERLSKSGADMNARNLRGATPLELSIRKEDSTLEEIRDFIACGCLLNSFNSLTEDGYIALADSLLTHEDMQRLLFGAFVNSPDSMKRDCMDRTVIHNMVSSNHTQSYEKHYVDLYDISIKFGCDIDEQDSLGRTALHLAAQFRNKEAIAGLLLVGADINVTDNDGKTPFAYVFEDCSRCADSETEHDQYFHFEMFDVFVTQIRKLQLCNLDLNKSNELLLSEAFEKFNPDQFASEVAFLSELEEMSKLQVEPFSIPLSDFISDAVAVIDYPLMSQDKRKAIDEFFHANKSHFQTKFKQAAGIFQLQYRQAVLRRKIIDKAKDSLSMLMNLRLPDICSHIVLRMLNNSELQNLIFSTM